MRRLPLILAIVAAPALAQPAPGIVDAVAVAGNATVPTEAILPLVHIKAGDSLTGPAQVKVDIGAIVALYRARGLDLAISPDIRHPAPGHVTITYRIDEAGHGGDAGAAPMPAPGAPK